MTLAWVKMKSSTSWGDGLTERRSVVDYHRGMLALSTKSVALTLILLVLLALALRELFITFGLIKGREPVLDKTTLLFLVGLWLLSRLVGPLFQAIS